MTPLERIQWAYSHDDLSKHAQAVLVFLAYSQNSTTGQCNPSVETIARMTKFSVQSVYRGLHELEDRETPLIRVNRGSRYTESYQLQLKCSSTSSQDESQGEYPTETPDGCCMGRESQAETRESQAETPPLQTPNKVEPGKNQEDSPLTPLTGGDVDGECPEKPPVGSAEDMFPNEPQPTRPAGGLAIKRYLPYDNNAAEHDDPTPPPRSSDWQFVLNPCMFGMRPSREEYLNLTANFPTYRHVRKFMLNYFDMLDENDGRIPPWERIMGLAFESAVQVNRSLRIRAQQKAVVEDWNFDWLTDQQREDRRLIEPIDKWGHVSGMKYHERDYRDALRDGDEAKKEKAVGVLQSQYDQLHEVAEKVRLDKAKRSA